MANPTKKPILEGQWHYCEMETITRTEPKNILGQEPVFFPGMLSETTSAIQLDSILVGEGKQTEERTEQSRKEQQNSVFFLKYLTIS